MKNNILNIKVAPISLTNGMAGSKRLMNLIDNLKNYQDITIENVFISKKHEEYNHGIKTTQIIVKNRFIGNCRLYKYLKKYKDSNSILYYYGQPTVFNFIALYFLRKNKIKVIFDIVEDYATYDKYTSFFNQLNIRLSTIILNHIRSMADGIIVINDFLLKKMIELTKNELPVIKLPISINTKEYPDIDKEHSDEIIVFYGGSFVYKDGVEDLINSFDKLSYKYLNTRLILTGKGIKEDIEVINKLLAKKNNNRIEFLGYVPDENYYQLIKYSTILCMPRKNIPFAIRGFPFKLGEYLATGNAVIASSIGDIPNIFTTDEICLYNPDIESDITIKLEYLINDEHYRNKLGLNGKKKAFELFDSFEHAKHLHTFLSQLSV